MTLRRTLTAVLDVIVDEAANNPEFRDRIEAAIANSGTSSALNTGRHTRIATGENRKGGRRAPAILDPVEVIKRDAGELRLKLDELSLERLLDIVAQYGMDPGKLVMKWKDRDRVIDRIMEVALSRATKGDAFRGG